MLFLLLSSLSRRSCTLKHPPNLNCRCSRLVRVVCLDHWFGDDKRGIACELLLLLNQMTGRCQGSRDNNNNEPLPALPTTIATSTSVMTSRQQQRWQHEQQQQRQQRQATTNRHQHRQQQQQAWMRGQATTTNNNNNNNNIDTATTMTRTNCQHRQQHQHPQQHVHQTFCFLDAMCQHGSSQVINSQVILDRSVISVTGRILHRLLTEPPS